MKAYLKLAAVIVVALVVHQIATPLIQLELATLHYAKPAPDWAAEEQARIEAVKARSAGGRLPACDRSHSLTVVPFDSAGLGLSALLSRRRRDEGTVRLLRRRTGFGTSQDFFWCQ